MIYWSSLIKNYRYSRAMTQSSFAELVDVDQATVSRWERETQSPDIATRSKLLSLLMPSDGAISEVMTMVDTTVGYASLWRNDWILLAMSEQMRRATEFDWIGSPPEPILSCVFSAETLWGTKIRSARAAWKHASSEVYWIASLHPMHVENTHTLLIVAEMVNKLVYLNARPLTIEYRDGRVDDVTYPPGLG